MKRIAATIITVIMASQAWAFPGIKAPDVVAHTEVSVPGGKMQISTQQYEDVVITETRTEVRNDDTIETYISASMTNIIDGKQVVTVTYRKEYLATEDRCKDFEMWNIPYSGDCHNIRVRRTVCEIIRQADSDGNTQVTKNSCN